MRLPQMKTDNGEQLNMDMTNASVTGIITKGVGGLYTVRPLSHGDELLCRARGVFRHEKIVPTAGDIVELELSSEQVDPSGASGIITAIHSRKNCLIRPSVANLTQLLIVVPAAFPKPDLWYIDKLTAIADALGIGCTVLVNKLGLDRESAASIEREYSSAGFCVFCTDALSGEGCDDVLAHIKSLAAATGENDCAVAAFAGVSGAGKSSLAGRLFPSISPEIGKVSRKTERGRHTTRAVELYPIADRLYLADTPGFSMLDFERFDFFEPELLTSSFRELAPYLDLCRYADCTHTKEEGCAVREAVLNGQISARRHESYVKLYEIMKKKPDWQRRE